MARPLPLGIINIGSTCYAAAALQALGHSPSLVAALDACPSREGSVPAALSAFFAALVKPRPAEYANVASLNPRPLFRMLSKCPQFRDFHFNEQNDAHEFAMALFDALLASKSSAKLKKVLTGMFSLRMICGACRRASCHRTEPFQCLTLAPGAASVEDSIEQSMHFTVPDWKCPKCGLCHVYTRSARVIKRAPRVLVVNFSDPTQASVKTSSIDPSIELCHRRYRLRGVVFHFGNSRSGHYVAHLSHVAGGALRCDDERVERMSGLGGGGRVVLAVYDDDDDGVDDDDGDSYRVFSYTLSSAK